MNTRDRLSSRQDFFQAAADQLQQEWADYRLIRSCSVFFNITNFHLYNTTHGFRQGDLCLQHIENILLQTFPHKLLAHLGADNFAILADAMDVEERITQACQRVQAFIGNPNIALKAGIRFLDRPCDMAELTGVFDNEAKLACDTIKKDASRHFAIYTEQLGLRAQMQNYVREHLDEALQKGYIYISLQPVIRTLTGELAGAEALARWESPRYGMISPNIFIPVLEEAHLIHKLDAHVLHAVAKMIRHCLDSHLPVLPVSVNLSRLDFISQDPFGTAEAIRQKYDLPLGLIQIEITENALVDKMEPVLEGLQKFQQSGYPVLLDDFGSGYSSLNVLKDYNFDTIKFDMKFLHPFTEKSRKILKYLVSMSKDLAIHTLAEGAETQEQCDFLREIGCEKIQGYYYGKPMPSEEFHQFCLDQGLHLETSSDAALLSKAGLVDLNQPVPTAIVYADSQKLRMLQANGLYLQSLNSIGTPDVAHVNTNLQSKNFPMNQKFRRFADRVIRTGQLESMTYVDNGQFLRLKARQIAHFGANSILQVNLYNISADRNIDDEDSHRFDKIVRNVLLTYDAIWYLNLEKDICEIVETLTGVRVGTQLPGVAGFFEKFASHYVHPADRERFLSFTAADSFYERAINSPRSFLSSTFRILMPDGRYSWMFFTSIAFVKSTSREMLLCLCQDLMTRQEGRLEIIQQMLDSYGITKDLVTAGQDVPSQSIWDILLQDTGLSFFWKDRQHRFRGASTAFLRERGITSLEEILGKTGQELGWQLHTSQVSRTEEQVMATGKPLLHLIEQMNIDHRIQKIKVSKYPVRENNQVIGVLVLLARPEPLPAQQQQQEERIGLIDAETKLLGYSGILMDALQYADEYRLHGEDYTALLLDVPEYDAIGLQYGASFRHHLLQRVLAILHTNLPQSCSLARIGSCCFLVLYKKQQDDAMQQALLRITQAIHATKKLDGHACTILLHYATAHGSEVRSIDSLMRLLMNRMQHAEEMLYGALPYSNAHLVFDREIFDHMEFGAVIVDPDNHDILYLNQAQRKELGMLPDEPLKGKKCYELMAGQNAPCEDCCLSKLSHTRACTRICHNHVMGVQLLLCHMLIPWNGKSCHFCLMINLDYYLQRHAKQEKLLYQEVSVNDIIRSGMYELKPENGIRKMMNRLGNQLGADDVLILEEKGDLLHFSYIWESRTATPLSKHLKPFPRAEVRPFYERFVQKPVFIIDDFEQFCWDNTDYAPRLPNIRQLIFARLRLDDHSYGYLEIVNPDPQYLEKAVPLLTALSRFFSILLRNRDMMQSIDHLSKMDPLTSIMNRRGLMDYIQGLPSGHQYAFFFGDLNGLKEMNDQFGHEAGDRLLQSAAAVLCQSCPTNAVFRMGGDEFLMIREVQDEKEAEKIHAQLHEQFRLAKIGISFGFALAITPIENIDTILAEADHNMYKEKVLHHQTHHQHSSY